LWFSHSAFSRTSLAKFSSLSCYRTERDRENRDRKIVPMSLQWTQ
jgi:hypothetical protein